MSNYTILHLHSMDSNPKSGLQIDSVTPFEAYIPKIVECGMNAVAFTEHGAVLHNVSKKQLCEKNNLKYIHAEEFYVTESISDELIRDNYHCLLYAKNKAGVEELNWLSSIASKKDGHAYYQPRITLEELEHTTDNIMILTGCVAGMLARGTKEVQERFLKFIIEHKERCWLEIQPHNFDFQVQYNQYLYRISKEYDLRLIATNDIHALNEEHLLGRKIMQKSKKIDFHDEDACDLSFKDYNGMVEAFKKQRALPEEVYLDALEETNRFAAQIQDYKLDYSNKYPRTYSNSQEELKARIKKGIKERGVDKLPNFKSEYVPRIREEFKTYVHNDAVDFILLDSDYKLWMKEHGMSYGPSRGSVSGSVIAYLIYCTDVDSIRFNLNFSRFMNPERVSLADVDTDIYADDRYAVREYFFNRKDVYCCNILTFNTIKMRGAIKDVARALEYTPEEAQVISNTVYTDENGNDVVPEDIRYKHWELFKYVDIVIGTITSLGRHAAGIVISPTDVAKDFGVVYIESDPRPVSQIDMHEIDSMNYVKLDLLGLNAIGLIDKTCKLVGIPFLTADNIDINDENVIKSIAEDTTLIFQFESGFASEALKKTFSEETISKIKNNNKVISYIDIMSMVSGAIRPAGESYRDALFNGEYHDNGEEALNKFLAPTMGYLVYQEQIIDFLYQFCGFTMGQADIIRRCVDENTLITTGYGYQKAIKDFRKGDNVISYNDYGYAEVDIVNDIFDNGIQDCFKIITSNGNELICTGSHKVLTQDGYKQVSELSNNDWIMSPSRIAYAQDGLRSNQRLNTDIMFMIGLLIGDGSLCGNNPSYVNHEIELINKYKSCVSKLSKSKKKCEFNVFDTDGKTVDKVYTIRITSEAYREALNKLLDRLGLKKQSSEKHISNELMSYPADAKLSNLLAGLFNSDGGYNINTTSIEYSSISEKLVSQIKCALLKYGIYSYITKSIVKGYDYYIYVLHISHSDSIDIFDKEILRYMIGKKKAQFKKVVDLAKEIKTFDYLLPQKCKEEILKVSSLSGKSIRSLALDAEYDLEIKEQYPSISNKKAKYFTSRLYCPETYKLLTSDYIPLKIKSIEFVGERHVYDIEVAKNHNYIANGLVVHNCFAKKTGTEKYLPVIRNGGHVETIHGDVDNRYVPGYINIAQEKYGMTRERAANSIEYFLRVIEDASLYLFSRNHAQVYSLIGYFIGWLRYYYPLQLLTAALNVYKANEKKMNEIKTYTRSKGIQIKPIKFRKSRADYFMDVEENSIYQDIESIKEMNANGAEELYELGKNNYDSFVALLADIKEKTCLDSNQLDILIKLDFFSEFGDVNNLLKIVEIYNSLYKRKQFNKADLEQYGVPEEQLKKYVGKETAKLYKDVDVTGLITELTSKVNESHLSLMGHIRYEEELLGYPTSVDPNYDKRDYFICDIHSNKAVTKLKLYEIFSGKTRECNIWNSQWEKAPIDAHNLIHITHLQRKPKSEPTGEVDPETGKKIRRDIPGQYEFWLQQYYTSEE